VVLHLQQTLLQGGSAGVKKALPPLLVATAGAAIAFLMVTVHVAMGLLVLIPLAAGSAAQLHAERVTRANPVGSLRWYGLAQLTPYGGAVAASAVLIGLVVWLAPPEKPPQVPGTTPAPPTTFEKYWPEILKVLAGALSTFITAAFLKSTEEPDKWVAELTKSEFQKAFGALFKAGSDGEQALRGPVYKGEGWDAPGRKKRAEAIASALNDPTQRR